jgi:malonyl-CoA decarboxylase
MTLKALISRPRSGPAGFESAGNLESGPMAEPQREGFFERTLGNLAGAWRDIAAGAARNLGLEGKGAGARDPRSLERLMAECLEARGGEVSARMRAAELGRTYLELDGAGKREFLEILAHRFAVDETAADEAIEAYCGAADPEGKLAAEEALRHALVPLRVKLLTQFNVLPEGVKFLADLRRDLLAVVGEDPQLKGLERDLRELLESWFDVGFLDLRAITWDSPASLLEKLIAYEAVHEISSWTDLRNRLDSDRRLYALFHPRMPDEPLAFVQVALVHGMADNVQTLLDETAPPVAPGRVDTAIFYSISNTQRGLKGISFGDYLIKRVVERFGREMPQVRNFATLSPVPGFMAWLERLAPERLDALLEAGGRREIQDLGEGEGTHAALLELLARPGWSEDQALRAALKAPLMRLCAGYFLETRPDGQPIDSVARFHLRNGARLERINWLADTSSKGLGQSAGLMVNYRYIREDIEQNHEAYVRDGELVMAAEVKALAKAAGRRRGH